MKITSITEFKEPRLVDPKSLLCTRCGLNNPEHVKLSICSHCRVSPKGDRVKGAWETVRAALKDLVFKDRKTALPSSVISD